MEVFGSSGTRGVVNEEITPEFVLGIAKAAGAEWGVDRIAVARDTRVTGEMLAHAATAGLTSVGADVDRLGVAPTPAVQSYAEREGRPAVIITASHNPPAYNGVKLIGADGVELAIDGLQRVEKTFLDDRDVTVQWDGVGETTRVENTNGRYVDQLVAAVARDTIADGELRVAIDPGHGAGALTSPRVFRELGCDVVTVNGHPDGHFPGRDPEPVRENLADLGRLVRTADADVGIAHDGDADRAIFFDERGEYIEGDAALAALAAAELEAGDTTVSAVNVSQRLVDVTNRTGATLELTPVGSTRIVTRIRELIADRKRVPIAGEGNGGIIFPEYRMVRDGAYTAARFLELVAERPASEVIEPYSDYHNVRNNIAYETPDERKAILDAIETYAAAEDANVTDTDGFRIDYGDAWVLARPSGTEPLVRVYAEARDPDRAAELEAAMTNRLREAKADA